MICSSELTKKSIFPKIIRDFLAQSVFYNLYLSILQRRILFSEHVPYATKHRDRGATALPVANGIQHAV